MNQPTDAAALDGVAIIGMAGRFPGASTIEEFWTKLRDGVESLTFFSDAELLAAGVDPALLANPNYVRAKGVLDGVERFDAQFFGYTPQEAAVMDPQHRIFLECGWHALENAGYCADSYAGAIGVYAGTNFNQYVVRHVMASPAAGAVEAFDKDFLATRLSYKLNLKGPSIVIQTACSTSLVAVAQACQSLLTYQCDMALAGGIAVHLPLQTGYVHHQGGILSPDGHCRAFDAQARGTVVGSGVGIVVLKRLADAIEDGDAIRAVIRGFAVNNDGSGKMGYTAPSIDGQAQAVAMAMELAGVEAGSIGCIEAHGTGTELGDPIEIAALTQAFRATTARTQFCAIGSVKTNIGHLDSAAGVTGLIKTALMLEHREIPASLHYERPNPKIDFATSPFFVNTKLTPWAAGPAPRRAGVSSFGIGGTNVHVVLEEAPARPAASGARQWQLLPVSARTPAALATAVENLAAFLEANPGVSLADVAFTLQAGRKAFKCRRAVVCRDVAEAIRLLRAPEACHTLPESGERPVVFAFPAEGRVSAASVHELYRAEPAFRAALDRCAAALDPEAPAEIRRRLAAVRSASPDEGDGSAAVRVATLFMFEYALAQTFLAWGITPAQAIGDGPGELVAGCVSGVLRLDDALRLATRFAPSPVSAPAISADAIVLRCGAAASGTALVPSSEIVAGPADDRPGANALEALTRALAQVWLRGASPDWLRYHEGARRHRLQLPLYPFEHQRFWIERQPPSAKRTLLGIGALQRDDFAEWFHAITWKRSPVPARQSPSQEATYLVFENDAPACERLVRRLVEAGCRVIAVRDGDVAARISESRHVINAAAPKDYDELIRHLAEAGSPPLTIVHAWGLTGSAETAPDDLPAESIQRAGFYSLLYLGQALGRLDPATQVRLLVVTDGVHEVVGGEPQLPEKATIAGPCRVIPQELPNVICRHVDMRVAEEPGGEESAGLLVGEILAASRDTVVAYRGGRRWVQACEGMRLPPVESASHPRLRRGGTYLITGGLGGVGLVLAEHLAEAFNANLILTGRRSIPERAEWETLLARTPADPAAARVRAVQRLESLGGNVIVAQADAANESEMRAAVAAGRARFGRIDGVIHAAGVAGGGVIQVKKREAAAAVLSPKVTGARVLARIFSEEPPGFLVLCSSMTSLLGGFGQADYCAANAYLDAFARQFARQTGAFAVSVNWNAWRDVGMAVETAVPENARDEVRAAILSTGLSNSQGVDAFVRILAGCPEAQVAISPNDLALLGFAAAMPDDQKLVATPVASAGAAVRRVAEVVRHPRPALQTPYLAPRSEVERQLCEVWQELLGIDRIGVHDNFFDLGGHSLLAIRVMARVNAVMQTNLPVARLYDGLTVEFLASLQGEQGEAPGDPDDGQDDARRDRLRRQREQQARRREAMSRT